jgi:hypothetical protein
MNHMPELAAMYSLMNDMGREHLVGMARQLLRAYAKQAIPASLTTLESRDDVQLLDDQAHCAIYEFPLVSVRKVVNGQQSDLG